MRICGAWGPTLAATLVPMLAFQSGADLWGVGTDQSHLSRIRLAEFQSGADLWGVGTPEQWPISHNPTLGFNPVRICGAWGQYPGLWGL